MYISKSNFCSYKWSVVSFLYILVLLPASVSGYPDECPESGRLANIFINDELLINAKVYQDISKATECSTPGTLCADPNICNAQLRNVPVSNLIPCCVTRENGPPVCQCVVKLPNSPQCPEKDLTFVSNQIFNMTGDSLFFGETYPICSSLHNSWNIYKRKKCPILEGTPAPFDEDTEEGKVGFQFFRADKFGEYCVIFYIEFLLTCKTDQAFISDDLIMCDQPCNSTLPFAEIWMDIPATHLNDKNNAVFKSINGISSCGVNKTGNQCPAKKNRKCNTSSNPCCYSNRCMFPFNPKNNTCPCPPPENNLIMATNGILTCDKSLNENSRLYLFKGDDPSERLVFSWDLNFDSNSTGGTGSGIFLFGRGTVILPLKSGGESLYWLGELKLPGKTFKGCLAEIIKNLKTKLPFPLKDLVDDAS